jgi:hypothetical protein
VEVGRDAVVGCFRDVEGSVWSDGDGEVGMVLESVTMMWKPHEELVDFNVCAS